MQHPLTTPQKVNTQPKPNHLGVHDFPPIFPSSFDIKHPSGPVAAEVALLLDQMEQLAQGVGRSSRLGEVFFDRQIFG